MACLNLLRLTTESRQQARDHVSLHQFHTPKTLLAAHLIAARGADPTLFYSFGWQFHSCNNISVPQPSPRPDLISITHHQLTRDSAIARI